MYPERAVLYMALGEAQWISTYEEGTYDFWVSLNHVYNLDMSLLADHAVARYKGISFVLLHSKFVVQFFLFDDFFYGLEAIHIYCDPSLQMLFTFIWWLRKMCLVSQLLSVTWI